MAEIDKETITSIGRRLREAAEAGQGGELPASILLGLKRLSGAASHKDEGSRGRQGEQETVEGAEPSVRPL